MIKNGGDFLKREQNRTKKYYLKIVEALQIIAAPYDKQIAIFPTYVCVPDEIALTFEDAMLHVGELQQEGLIEQVQIEKLKELARKFDSLVGENEWSLSALKDTKKWKCIRKKAKILLSLLEEKWSIPKKVEDVQFIRANEEMIKKEKLDIIKEEERNR